MHNSHGEYLGQCNLTSTVIFISYSLWECSYFHGYTSTEQYFNIQTRAMMYLYDRILQLCLVISITGNAIATEQQQQQQLQLPESYKRGYMGRSVYSKNIPLGDCVDPSGLATCCTYESKHLIHAGGNVSHLDKGEVACTVTRIYVPSPYETQQLAQAIDLCITNKESRPTLIEALLNDTEKLKNVMWVDRVKARMRVEQEAAENHVDREYLSYFQITRTCPSGHANVGSSSWKEWIEPLTMHTRHPLTYYGLLRKPRLLLPYRVPELCDVDYILLNSGENLRKGSEPGQRVLVLDAGCADDFSSSLQWFGCGYASRGVFVDEMYGWELRKLDEEVWMQTVPQAFTPSTHLFNVGITADVGATHNPLEFIRHHATPNDYVALKLDIDYTEVEMPLLLQLKNDSSLLALVDEFFFEVSHACHALRRFEKPYRDMSNTRADALLLFKELREKGLRAHFWP
jgi:hypothetical protein